jgi:hypothetical protein
MGEGASNASGAAKREARLNRPPRPRPPPLLPPPGRAAPGARGRCALTVTSPSGGRRRGRSRSGVRGLRGRWRSSSSGDGGMGEAGGGGGGATGATGAGLAGGADPSDGPPPPLPRPPSAPPPGPVMIAPPPPGNGFRSRGAGMMIVSVNRPHNRTHCERSHTSRGCTPDSSSTGNDRRCSTDQRPTASRL